MRTAIVTGGASGMARATGEMLHERGASVAILDLAVSDGAEVAKGLDGPFFPVNVMDDAETLSALLPGEGVRSAEVTASPSTFHPTSPSNLIAEKLPPRHLRARL